MPKAIVLLLVLALGLRQASGQQANEHELASVAPADSAGALAVAEDLLAAESSQAPDGLVQEHKAFTSGQMLRQESSVAPPVYGPGQQQQQQQVGGRFAGPPPQQQQMQHHMAAAGVHPKQPQAAMAPPPHLNPFMAAALAGNYGPAQQQMAAAALHAQQQQAQAHHHMHHSSQQQQQHASMHQPPPQMMQQQQQQQIHHPHPSQVLAVAPQSQQHAQQPQVAPPQMAVQESSVRHNVVAAPAPAPAPVESNSIELNELAAPAALAASPSGQHSIVASASSSAPVGSSAPVAQQEAWPLQAPDIPKIVNLEVKCEKNLMKVSVEFDKVFNGVIFSKGHFNQGQCVHVGPNSNKQQSYFDISINSCGTQGNTQNGLYGMGQNTGSGSFFENTIVIQYDPNVQEVYDHARKLRCTWHDQYEKAVTFRPFPVDMLDIVRADFAGDNVGCWMQIQVGKGPWASEVAGIVKIGQTMTMVLAIKDEENKFDMLVRNCFAHDGKRGPIELVDKSGCITRPKLMSRFTKIKNFGSSATVLSYAHFQAFKFPDSMEVHFQCTIQICRHQCPEQCSAGPGQLAGAGSPGGPGAHGETYSESTISGTFNIHSGGQGAGADAPAGSSAHLRKFGSSALSRARRSAAESRWLNGSHHSSSSNHHHHHHNNNKPNTQSVGLNRVIQVVSTGDLAFAINKDKEQQQVAALLGPDGQQVVAGQAALASRVELGGEQICMSSFNFVLGLVTLALILLCSCLAAISLYIRQRSLLASGNPHKLALPSGCSSPAGSVVSSMMSGASRHLLATTSPQAAQQQQQVRASTPLASSNNYHQQFVHHTQVPTQKQQQQQHFYSDRR